MSFPSIRPATEADIPAVAHIYREAFSLAPYHEEWTLSDASDLLLALLRKDPDTCFCLDNGDGIIGFAFCSTVGRFRAVVEEIAIHPHHHGRGWGRFLLTHCIDLFKGRGYPAVELIANSTAPAYAFYQALGFRQARRNVLMLRDL